VLLLVKLVLTPAIVVLATLAGRRFGRIASGWLIGLPLTSGPIAAFFAVEHGTHFAARAAVGSLGGGIAEVAFCVGYAAAARGHRWPVSVLCGSAAFAAAAAILEALPLAAQPDIVLPLAVSAALALLLGLRFVPHVPPARDAEKLLPSRWDVPARAATATAFLLALTALATTLGPRLSGLLAVYPLYTVVLAAFTHRLEGEAGAVQVLRGLLVGLFSFVCFYATLATSLTAVGTAGAFTLAFAVAFAVQALSLRPMLRLAAA
jgi:hypothetical protein